MLGECEYVWQILIYESKEVSYMTIQNVKNCRKCKQTKYAQYYMTIYSYTAMSYEHILQIIENIFLSSLLWLINGSVHGMNI